MKKVIIIFIIITIIAVPAYLAWHNQQSQDDFYVQLNNFNALLKTKEYEQVKSVYDNATSTLKANYNISLDSYADILINDAENMETQDALDLLYAFKEIGYASEKINNTIIYYEDLMQSNYIYLQGLEHYNNSDFENAIKCFSDVLEYDENYEQAQEYVKTYQEYLFAWDQAAENNLYGRSPKPNAIAYYNNYIYVPYRFSNSIAILKINTTTYSVQSFPVISNKNNAEISNINIVGEYIFFLLKYKNPASEEEYIHNGVYRISVNGQGLTKILDCDYSYLITYGDEFYAVSESKGLIKADKYFIQEEVLYETRDEIIDVEMVEDGIYFTLDEKESDNNIVYFYDGEVTEKVLENVNIRYYNYGENYLFYYDVGGFAEKIYHKIKYKMPQPIVTRDIYKYYGRINDSILMTYIGDYQQECAFVVDLNTFYSTYRAESDEIKYVPIGICYEQDTILLKSEDGIALTSENMRIQQNITLPHINSTVLQENEQLILSSDYNEYFTEESMFFTDDNRWMYSDENININIEKIYLYETESTVYIANIYSDSYKWMKLNSDQSAFDPYNEKIVWAIPGQLYTDEVNLIDEEKNIINKDIYVFNDDGMFIPYRKDNFISSERILSDKTIYVFHQGNIILENYSITDDCLADTGFSGRTAVGMVEPGHYIFITAEDVSTENKGLSIYRLAQLFQDYGCISAFAFENDNRFNIFNSEYIYGDKDITKNEQSDRQTEIIYYQAE